MSKFTTFANGRSVATKGTHHMARHTAPDVCKLPDGKPKPFANYVLTTKLAKGQTTRTKIAGAPIWTAAGEVGPLSEPAHEGVGGGVVSGTYRLEAKPTSFSGDVIVEGNGVVRMFDTTLQNHGNCPGIVDDADNLAAFLAEFQKELDAAGLGPGEKKAEPPAPPKKAAPPKAKTDEKKPVTQPPQVTPKPKTTCQIKAADTTISCAHGRKAAASGLLEVVAATGGDTITCKGAMEGTCANGTHPEWKIGGVFTSTKKELETSFRALEWAVGRPGWLSNIVPRQYAVTFSTHEGSKNFTVKAYPTDTWKITIEKPPSLDDILETFERILRTVVKGFALDRPSIKGGIEAGWSEHGESHVAFYKYKIWGGFDPLIGVKGRFSFGPVAVIPPAIMKYVGAAGLFIELGGKLGLTFNFERSSPTAHVTTAQLDGSATVKLGLELALFSENVLSAEAYAETGIYGSATGVLLGDKPAVKVKVDLGGLKGIVTVKVAWGWINLEKQVTIFDPMALVPEKTFPLV